MAGTKSNAKWARWTWSHKGLGRWHRLFADGDLTKTACGSARASESHVASVAAERPTEGPLCPICKSLDDLLIKVQTGALTDAVTTTTIEVPAATPRPLAPVGVCICGCVKSDEVVAYKRALEDWEQAERERKSAEFEAFLVTKAVAS